MDTFVPPKRTLTISLYGGRVGFVDTKQYYFDASESPQDAIHHFNHNALTYLNIGEAMGNEMILAVNDMAFCYKDSSRPMLMWQMRIMMWILTIMAGEVLILISSRVSSH